MSHINDYKNEINQTSDDLENFIKDINKLIKKSKKCKKHIKHINDKIIEHLQKEDCIKLLKQRDNQYELTKKYNAAVALLNIESGHMLTEVIKRKNIEHILS